VSVAEVESPPNQQGYIGIVANYDTDYFDLWVNGIQVGTDISGAVPACSVASIGVIETSGTGNRFNDEIYRAGFGATVLSASESQDLSTRHLFEEQAVQNAFDQDLNTFDDVSFNSVQAGALQVSGSLPTGTIASPPSVDIGDNWLDTTDSASNPIMRQRIA